MINSKNKIHVFQCMVICMMTFFASSCKKEVKIKKKNLLL